MASVQVLPDDLVDQIAAGEVVERPASVVKELIENALDAGAQAIRVEVERGGTTSIIVQDDGEGMAAADALLAVRRHATSKLRTKEDLERIATMGFRGEALPSIASVSRFVLRTRTAKSDEGVEVRIAGGAAPETVPVGASVGTTVLVEDLFYNVPARRKFLKSIAVEAAHVSECVVRTALARPDVRFTLVRDRRTIKDLPGGASRVQRARAVIDEPRLDAVEGERDGIRVMAVLSPPERARSGATQLHLFVNGRPVRDRAIARSVAFAFGSVLPPGRYPVGAVWIELALERVDVNVHPQKSEVRFEDSRVVLDSITRTLAAGLGQSPFRPTLRRDKDFWESRWASPEAAGSSSRPEPKSEPVDPWGLSSEAPSFAPPSFQPPAQSDYPLAHDTDVPVARDAGPSVWEAELDHRSPDAPSPPTRGLVEPGLSLRVLGQAGRLYIVCESPGGLVVIDQHAADERVRFAKLKDNYEQQKTAIQRLLLPERIPVAPTESALIREHENELVSLGLEVRLLDDATAVLSGVPALLGRASPSRLLRDVLGELARAGSRAFGDSIDTVLATVACHGAVRGGDALSLPEMEQLIKNLGAVSEFRGHCPHGRPVVTTVSFDELSKRVGR